MPFLFTKRFTAPTPVLLCVIGYRHRRTPIAEVLEMLPCDGPSEHMRARLLKCFDKSPGIAEGELSSSPRRGRHSQDFTVDHVQIQAAVAEA